MNPFEVIEGDAPLILTAPHAGTWIPASVGRLLNPRGRALADTDWHVDRLYDGLAPGLTRVTARFHRYLIDANRDPSGESLYPGQNTTGLCPLTDFDGEPIWLEGGAPDAAEVERRLRQYHAAYHLALADQIARLRAIHGIAIVYDCHSIRSRVPRLFEGELPVFNIGTDQGATCASAIESAVADICGAARDYDCVVNGRFRGGWTTRHYGRPAEGVHAIQMELAQRAYLEAESPPWAYSAARAEPLRAVLARVIESLLSLAQDLKRGLH